MANKIKIKRGAKANLPSLDIGELALCTDTKQVFIGSGDGNIEVGGGADIIYDYIVDSQPKLNALLASPTWLNAKNILFAANVTVTDKQMVIPPTVERIDGINSATITFDLHYEIYSDGGYAYGKPAFGYAVKPAGRQYQINNLNLKFDFDDTTLTFVNNCINLTNVNIMNGDKTNSQYYWEGFDNCDNLKNCTANLNLPSGCAYSAFVNCSNLYGCTGTCICEGDTYGGAFNNCYNLVNCTGDKRMLSRTENYGREVAAFAGCRRLVNCIGTALRYNSTASNEWEEDNKAYVFWGCTDMVNCSKSNITQANMITDDVYYGNQDIQKRIEDLSNNTGGKKYATLVVGTTKSGHTAGDVDYLCTGTDDQVKINAAIAALPSVGGKVIVREGTYNISGIITVNKDNVTLEGAGKSTCLRPTNQYSGNYSNYLINITGSYCSIKDFKLGRENWDYGAPNCIKGTGDCCTITGNLFCCSNMPIYITCNHSVIAQNMFHDTDNGSACIIGNYNVITGNMSYYCFAISTNGNNNTITGNVCTGNCNEGIYSSGNNNTITGNTCINNGKGILIYGSNNAVTGNTCNNNEECGIYIEGSNNEITGNTALRGNGAPSDYYSSYQNSIYVGNYFGGKDTKNNLIACNNIMGRNYVDESGNTTNTFVNNKWN